MCKSLNKIYSDFKFISKLYPLHNVYASIWERNLTDNMR